MLQRIFPFSQYKTAALILALAVFTFGNIELASASTRPNFLSLLQHELYFKQWTEYLASIRFKGKVSEKDFVWLIEEMRILARTPQEMDRVIEVMQSTRDLMPVEFRWVLAAAELHRDKIAPMTAQDAFSALVQTGIYQSGSLMGGMSMSLNFRYIIRNAYNREFKTYEARFNSIADLLFLFGNLHRAPELEPHLFVGTDAEDVRIRWLSHLRVMSKEVHASDILAAVLKLADQKARQFSTREKKEQFLLRMIDLVTDFGFRFGDAVELNTYGKATFKLSDGNSAVFNRLRQLVRSWLVEDLIFASMNYDIYLRRGYITMDDFLSISMNDLKKAEVEKVIKKTEKVEFAPYVLNALLWVKNYAGDGSQTSLEATENLGKILLGAQLGIRNSLVLQDGLIKNREYIYPVDYLKYLNAFYEIAVPPVPMSKAVLDLAKRIRHVKFEFMSDEDWLKLERHRLHFIQKHSSTADFNSYIRKIFVDGAMGYSLKDRIFVAKVFREIGDPAVAQEMADVLKAQTRSRFYFNKASAVRAAWNKDEGSLVHLVFAMSPRDPDLNAYLVDRYVNHARDAAISGQNALRMLEAIGNTDIKVREEILRSLQFMGAGDSAGTLSALLRLFPDQGPKIVEIMHEHTADKERKLAPMLMVLRDRALENPQILQTIREAVRAGKNTPAGSSQAYQGLRLDEWLERQVNYLTKIKEVKTCEAVWRQYEN